jgi:hypothetical protein
MVDATVSTDDEVPGLDPTCGLFVLADGTGLVSTSQNTLQLLTPAGSPLSSRGTRTRTCALRRQGRQCALQSPWRPDGGRGHIVVVDSWNHALRRVSKAGEVSTLAGNGKQGFTDGQGDAARFNWPGGVALAANDEKSSLRTLTTT